MKPAHNRTQMEGKKFGHWQVISYSHTNNKISYYLCECTYDGHGEKFIVDGRNIRNGRSKQCVACGHKIRALGQTGVKKSKLTDREMNIKYLYNDKKKSAKSRGIEWALTMSEFESLIFQNCYYTGLPPSTISNPLRHNDLCDKWIDGILCNGIDRLDSDKGYVMGNVVPCNTDINRMKLDHSVDDFLNLVKAVAVHLKLVKSEDNTIKLEVV